LAKSQEVDPVLLGEAKGWKRAKDRNLQGGRNAEGGNHEEEGKRNAIKSGNICIAQGKVKEKRRKKAALTPERMFSLGGGNAKEGRGGANWGKRRFEVVRGKRGVL